MLAERRSNVLSTALPIFYTRFKFTSNPLGEECTLHCGITSSATTSLYSTHDFPCKVLRNIWYIADGVAVG